MIRAVVVSHDDLAPQLRETALGREDAVCLPAAALSDVRRLAQAERPQVVAVDCALPSAAELVAALRRDPLTRGLAIVALARSDFGLGQLELLDAGANAILPLPPGPGWDERLARLVDAPARRAIRLGVELAVEGGARAGRRFPARAVNLSVNGVLLQCRDPLEVGDDLQFALELPGCLGAVHASGTVVRSAPPQMYGVEFTALEGDGGSRIRSYVESASPD